MRLDLRRLIVRSLGVFDGPILIAFINLLDVNDDDICISFNRIRLPIAVVERNLIEFAIGLRLLRVVGLSFTMRTFPITREGDYIYINISASLYSNHFRRRLWGENFDDFLNFRPLSQEQGFRHWDSTSRALNRTGDFLTQNKADFSLKNKEEFLHKNKEGLSRNPYGLVANNLSRQMRRRIEKGLMVTGSPGGDPDKGNGSQICFEGDERAKPTKKIVYRQNGRSTVAFFQDISPEDKLSQPLVLRLTLGGSTT